MQSLKTAKIIKAIDDTFDRVGHTLYTNDLFRFAQRKYEELKKNSESESTKSRSVVPKVETGKLLQDHDISQVVDETQTLVQAEIRTSNLWLPILGFEAARPGAAKKLITPPQCSLM